MNSRRSISLRMLECLERLLEDGIVNNKTQFASKIGTYPTVIADIEKKKRNFSIDQIVKFLELYSKHLSPNELFGFETNNITFLTEATAGPSISVDDEKSIDRFNVPGLEGDLYAFSVSGNSMSPTLENRDILICTKIEDQVDIDDGKIYVVRSNDGINVKRIKINRNGKVVKGITLLSDNSSEYPPSKLDFSEGLHSSPNLEFYRPIKRITDDGLE